MNITDKTVEAIQTMVRESFITNSRLDRMKSCLNASLAYPNTASLIHKLAHKYALEIGDGIGDLIENYNICVNYGDLPIQVKMYSSAKEALTELLEITINFQNKLNMCTKLAFDNMDIHTYTGLLDIVEDHDEYVQQAILWKDEIDKYGDNPSFDAHIKSHYTIMDLS